MSLNENEVQSLCSATEWKTVLNSFPPKLDNLGPSLAKNNANRIARFLEKAKNDDEQSKVIALKEALERVRSLLPIKVGEKKLSSRRLKEKKARQERRKQQKNRAMLKEKFQSKTQTQKPGDSSPDEESKPSTKKKSVREWLQPERT